MSLTNYADLQDSIAKFLHRTDLATVIPDLITLAEARINTDLNSRLQSVKTLLTATSGVDSIELPVDLIGIRHFSVASSSPAKFLDYETPDVFVIKHPYGEVGIPRAYTIIGQAIYLVPIPGADYELNLIYKSRVPNLATQGATWLLSNYPNIYLYGALCESAPYLKDDTRIAVWEDKYVKAVNSVNVQDWNSNPTMVVRTC